MSPTPRQMGRRLEKLRKARELSRARLAELAGISREYVRKLEAGAQDPTIGTLQKLAHALEVPIVALLIDAEGWLAEESAIAPVFSSRSAAEAAARAKGRHFVWRLFEAGAIPRIRGPLPVREGTRKEQGARPMTTYPAKVALLSNYLKELFPGHDVYDAEDFDRDCHIFRIDQRGHRRYLARVAREFLDDHPEKEILSKLRAWQVKDVMRSAASQEVLITENGCSIEPPASPARSNS